MRVSGKTPAYKILTCAMRVKIALGDVLCTFAHLLIVQRGSTSIIRKIKIVESICVSFAYF